MQIKNIKISNVLSFKYCDSTDCFEGVDFSTSEQGVISILIGPNGSGKSNFIEVINQILQVGLFKSFTYSVDTILDPKKDTRNAIIENKVSYSFLKKHVHYKDKPSEVWMTLKLSAFDFENIHFLIKYCDEINLIIKKYSNIDVQFTPMKLYELFHTDILNVKFTIDIDNKKILLDRVGLTKRDSFLFDYIEYFGLIQKCVEIHNFFEKENTERQRYPLKNTFAIFGSFRNYHHLSSTLMLLDSTETDAILRLQNTKVQFDKPLGFELAKKKLVSHYNKILGKVYFYSLEEIYSSDLYSTLNTFLENQFQTTLKIGIDVKQDGYRKYSFYLEDKDSNMFDFDDLSSGEKSLMITIFSIYGFDLQNGFMIIDEPELHLHPQLQKTFVDILQGIAEQLSMQFIIATHSSVMVNENNINNVYRFYQKHDFTHIMWPRSRFIDQEANLIQMLKYTHSSKIFFVSKIILVEGETDEYFFNFYLHYLTQFPARKALIRDYEIVNINGKGSFRMRKSFLSKFGLECYYIGDWDNIRDEGVKMDFDLLYKQCKKSDPGFGTPSMLKTEKYARLVSCIRTNFKSLDLEITKKMNQLENEDTFLLRKGDLEAYLGLHEKGLAETVDFCQHDFFHWLKNDQFDEYRNDLEVLFKKIFE